MRARRIGACDDVLKGEPTVGIAPDQFPAEQIVTPGELEEVRRVNGGDGAGGRVSIARAIPGALLRRGAEAQWSAAPVRA